MDITHSHTVIIILFAGVTIAEKNLLKQKTRMAMEKMTTLCTPIPEQQNSFGGRLVRQQDMSIYIRESLPLS